MNRELWNTLVVHIGGYPSAHYVSNALTRRLAAPRRFRQNLSTVLPPLS